MTSGTEFDPRIFNLFRQVWNRRMLVLACALVSGLLFGVYAFVVRPTYRVDTVLAPVEDQEQTGALSQILDRVGGLAAVAGAQFDRSGKKDEAIAVLRSRALGDQFIREHDLLKKLFARRWDAQAGRWRESRFGHPPTPQDGYRLFERKVRTVNVDQKSGLVTLSVRWTDPIAAAEWADGLVKLANKKIRDAEIAEASSSLAFLNRELEKTNVLEVRQAIYRLVEAQTRRIMLANVREEFAFRVIDPPIAPDADKFERPLRALLIVLGLIVGSLAACAWVLIGQARLALQESVRDSRQQAT